MRGNDKKGLTLTLLLTIFTRSILGIARRLLLGQKLDQLFGLLALPGFGGGLGFFRFPALALFRFAGSAFGGLCCQALFLGALGGALVAGLGNGQAFLGALLSGGLDGFGAGLGLGQHFGARLGGVFQPCGEFGVVAAGHEVLLVVEEAAKLA